MALYAICSGSKCMGEPLYIVCLTAQTIYLGIYTVNQAAETICSAIWKIMWVFDDTGVLTLHVYLSELFVNVPRKSSQLFWQFCRVVWIIFLDIWISVRLSWCTECKIKMTKGKFFSHIFTFCITDSSILISVFYTFAFLDYEVFKQPKVRMNYQPKQEVRA